MISDVSHKPDEGRPFGLFGLAAGFCLILLAAFVFCSLTAAFVGGAATLAFGLHRVAAILSAWRDALTKGDTRFMEAVVIVLSLLFYAGVAAAVFLAARLRGRRGWRDVIGWRRWQPFRGTRGFWTIAAVTIVYGFAASALVATLYPPSKTWVVLPERPLWTALFLILAIVFAPIAEELLFRGWIYTGLRRKIGIWQAINVSAALFAIAHWEKTQIYALVVFPVGLALGYVRERTGSLKASMTFHAVYNAAASVLLVLGY